MFANFVNNNDDYNNEVSSDDECASLTFSDAVPEEEDYESDEFSGENSNNMSHCKDQNVCGRTWRYISPTNRDAEFGKYDATLTANSEGVETMEQCFDLFINDEIMDIIITYTNEKAVKYYEMFSNNIWKPVDRVELKAFFGILLITGRFRESRESKKDLWKKKIAYSRQIYRASMSRDRFTNILRFLRFDDFQTREERKMTDKLAALRTITNILTRNCRDNYRASNVGTIDEQLVTFRGRCPFKVYMPSKPGKYGLKLWALCDATTYYCCNFEVYLGKCGNTPEKGQGQRVVRVLSEFWKGSNRTITTDNFFTDISLAEDLLKDNIFIVGTMRKNRKDLPKSLITISGRAQFSSDFIFSENLTLVSYIPKPRKCVVLLSSVHREHAISDENNNYKPNIINYYNSTKSGVDVLDKILREYTCRRCTRRWPLSLFLHYIDIAAYNAFVLWQLKNPDWATGNIKSRRKQFIENLSEQLVAANIDSRARAFETNAVVFSRHIVDAIESTGRKINKQMSTTLEKRSRCSLCIGNDNKYKSKCDVCHKYVCNIHSTCTKNILCTNCNDLE